MIRWLIGLAWLVSGYAAEPVELSGRAMGTTWSAKCSIEGVSVTPAEARARLALRLEELEAIFSTYRANSVVSRFNVSGSGDWIEVPADVATVAQQSRRVSELTGGAYDVTVAPLLALWGFGPAGAREREPSAPELEAARRSVGYGRLQVRMTPPALRKEMPGAAVDFSSMVKGFAADEMSRILSELGAASSLVQVGGDVKVRGARSWRLGVEQPREAKLAVVLELSGERGLSTSGNVRNVVERDGRRWGHIVDPRSGRPVESDVSSVSVVHPSCAMSSALATGLFVLGADAGLALAQREGWAVLYLMGDGQRRATAPFEALAAGAR